MNTIKDSKIMREDNIELPFCKRLETTYEIELMGFQNRCLLYLGILPLKDTNEIWKIKLYRFYQVLGYIMYIPVILMEIYGCFHYRNDLNVVIDAIVPIGLGCIGFFVPLTVNWDNVLNHFEKMETKSAFIRIINDNNRKKIAILEEHYHWSRFFTKTFVLIANITGITWGLQVYLLEFLETLTGENHSNSTINEEFPALKLYPIVVHLPYVDMTDTVICIILNVIIMILIIMTCNRAGMTIVYFSTLLLYHSTLFTLVAVSLEEVDTEDSINIESNFNTSHDIGQPVIRKENNRFQDSFENYVLQKTQCNNLDIVNKRPRPIKSSMFNYSDNENQTEIANEEQEIRAIDLLKDAIKDHQEALQYVDRVNDLISSYLFSEISVGAVVLALALFESVVNPNFAAKAKHVASALAVVIGGWIVFRSGATVTDQGQKVCEAACNTLWYKHSMKFRKLLYILIWKSQKPVIVVAGPLIEMTEKNFADVVNGSYSYFTLLLQFESTKS
ncbi:Odorant receptor 123 [Blattella germanica]|nr:Odorant receptor 123 [Blattella germanica]